MPWCARVAAEMAQLRCVGVVAGVIHAEKYGIRDTNGHFRGFFRREFQTFASKRRDNRAIAQVAHFSNHLLRMSDR